MLVIDSRTAHLWIVDFSLVTDPAVLQRYRNLLSEDEATRLARFAFPALQHKYLVTRAMVRTCLSHYADVAPQDWRFTANEHGKPYLLDPPLPLSFNLTHSGERAALAVSLDTPIGVDIEQVSHQRDWLGIAQHYFHADEVERLTALPEAEQYVYFFQLWTLKEAYLKARGTGIATGLDKASFILSEHISARFAPELEDDTAAWQFNNYKVGSDYSLALALRQPQDQLTQVRFFQSWPLQDNWPPALALDTINAYRSDMARPGNRLDTPPHPA